LGTAQSEETFWVVGNVLDLNGIGGYTGVHIYQSYTISVILQEGLGM
jgi:hypothetical protein